MGSKTRELSQPFGVREQWANQAVCFSTLYVAGQFCTSYIISFFFVFLVGLCAYLLGQFVASIMCVRLHAKYIRVRTHSNYQTTCHPPRVCVAMTSAPLISSSFLLSIHSILTVCSSLFGNMKVCLTVTWTLKHFFTFCYFPVFSTFEWSVVFSPM